MALYVLSKNGIGLSTSNDFCTLVTTATGQGSVLRLREVSFSGEAGSTAFARIAVFRPSAVGITIGGTVQTPQKVDPASVNAAFSAAGSASAVSGWGTQPVIGTDDVLIPAFNAFGGVYRWVAPPDSEIVVGSQGAVANLSFRSRSGTSTISGHIVVEER